MSSRVGLSKRSRASTESTPGTTPSVESVEFENTRNIVVLLDKKGWDRLLTPPTELNFELVREFYANALPLEGQKCAYCKKVASKKWNFALVDVVHIILKDMRAINVSGHSLGSKVPTTLAYPGFIMGLCRQAGIEIPRLYISKSKVWLMRLMLSGIVCRSMMVIEQLILR
ncbi:hypothetical protein RYX36_009582 [Vicia faba]